MELFFSAPIQQILFNTIALEDLLCSNLCLLFLVPQLHFFFFQWFCLLCSNLFRGIITFIVFCATSYPLGHYPAPWWWYISLNGIHRVRFDSTSSNFLFLKHSGDKSCRNYEPSWIGKKCFFFKDSEEMGKIILSH